MENLVLNSVFYVFAALMLFSGIMVITSRNPVHSVLFLIFAFFNAAALFVLIGAEYVAMTLVIVYVGAVAVLFLFVVMMMDIDFAKWRQGYSRYLPAGLILSLSFLISVGAVMYISYTTPQLWVTKPSLNARPLPQPEVTNAEQIGLVLYTDYAYVFLVAGMVLFVAMVGAIVLTLRHQASVKRQNISMQLRRQRSESVELVDIQTGKGIEL